MCEEGWCVGLRKKGAAWGRWETSEYLGGIEKRGGKTKILERGGGGQAGSSVGALKRGGGGGGWSSLTKYVIT